jgi:hypothetical protein
MFMFYIVEQLQNCVVAIFFVWHHDLVDKWIPIVPKQARYSISTSFVN